MTKDKKSIKISVYNKLKTAILKRKLSPGTQLVENTISTSLNVSRTPIRSAIEQLAIEGLVEIIPNRGAFVISPTIEEVNQAYHLRQKLEVIAVDTAINNLDSQDFLKMEKFVDEEKDAINKKDVLRYLKANQDFHMTIVNKCGNVFLIEFIEKLIRQTSIYLILFDVYFEENSLEPYGYLEHLEIVRLLKQKDKEGVNDCLIKHVDHAINSLDIRNTYQNLPSIFEG